MNPTNPTPTQQETLLLPCPFCGIAVIPNPMDVSHTYHPIMVNDCPLNLTTINWSIEQWNTRAAVAEPRGDVLLSQMWQALKAECCKNPEEAKTIVFLGEEKFKKALAHFAAAPADSDAE